MKIDFLLIKCDGWTRALLSLYSLPFLTRKFAERMQSQSQLPLRAGHCQVHRARNIFRGFLAATTKWFLQSAEALQLSALPWRTNAVERMEARQKGGVAPCVAALPLWCSAQPLRGSGIETTRSCVSQGTNDDADVGGLLIGGVLCY